MKLLRRVGAIFDLSIAALAVVAAVILIFLWGLLTIGIIGRLLVGFSIYWSVEVIEFCLFAMGFLGAAWVLKKEGHVKVDMVYDKLNPRGQALLNITTSIIGIVICLFLVWYGTRVTIDHFQRGMVTTTALRWAIWPRYAIVALGSLLLLIQFNRRAYGSLLLWRMLEGKEVAPREEKIDLKGEA